MGKASCPTCGAALEPATDGVPPQCRHCTPPVEAVAETKTSTGERPVPPARSYRGRSFGNYTILEEISRGAMGVVYKARQHALNRVVALKVLLAGDLATDAQVARFQREAQAAARLRHPAIVPIHEVGLVDGKHFYTMDYIEGVNLSEVIRAGTITTRRALDIAGEVAAALDYAHSQGVIHRDIKPSNIMIDAAGKVHILDFGLAKQVDSDTKFTRTGTTIGTPAYMPPEQAGGQNHRIDQRADIYSAGAVLYEMLTGIPPFSGNTMMSTLMKVLNDEPAPPKRLNPRIHRDIQTIVLKAMEKSQERRYPTAGAMADDIRRFIAGESISARPAGLLYRCWRAFKKHRSAVFAVAAIAIIGLAAYAVTQQQRADARRQIEQARKSGIREGAEEVAKALLRQERPTVMTVFDDDFTQPSLAERWTVESGPWRQAGDGRLEVAAGPLAATHTRKAFSGNVTVTFEVVFPPQADGSPQPDGAAGCYLGSDWRHSYRVSFGGPKRHLVLTSHRGEEVAELAVDEPVQTDASYLFTLERSPMGLHVVVETGAGDFRQELSFNDVSLPRQLGNQFAAGLFTEFSRVQVRRFRVQQELPPLKTSSLQAAEELFRDGNLPEARTRYEKIVQAYEGRYEGFAAMVGVARCQLVEGHFAPAIELLRRVEQLAPQIRHEKLPDLLTSARLLDFFCSANLNNFADAAKALDAIAESGATISPAWLWHFPKHLSDLINNRAYDEALNLLETPVFGPGHQSLYAAAYAYMATLIQSRLVRKVCQLADGFADGGQPEKVKAVYTAFPNEELATSFARAAQVSLRNGQRDEALSLLSFCTRHRMKKMALAQVAVALATSFCDGGLYSRVPEVYDAFPEPGLRPLFLRSVRDAATTGKLDDSRALLEIGLRTFPESAKEFLPPAVALARAFVARGDFHQPIAIHAAFGGIAPDASLKGLFVDGARAAIEARKLDDARLLLDHARITFGLADGDLAELAVRLVTLHAAEKDYERVISAYTTYPAEALAPVAARVIAEAAPEHLAEALALFTQYARSRHPIPADAVRAVADALAAVDPRNEEGDALLAQYRNLYEIYDTPAPRSALTLALGEAYVRAGALPEAMAQFDAAGDAEGLLRAACVALELRLPDAAAARWQKLRGLAEGHADRVAIAAFMTGATAAADFLPAAAAARLPAPLVSYLVGLRLWAGGDPAAADELAKAAADPPAWFTPLARRGRAPIAAPEEGEP